MEEHSLIDSNLPPENPADPAEEINQLRQQLNELQDLSMEIRKAKAQVENELADSRARLSNLEARAQIGAWELDLRSRMVWGSKGFFDITGLEPDEEQKISFSSALSVLHHSKRAEITRKLDALLDGGSPDENLIIENRRKIDRKLHYLQTRYTLVTNDDGIAQKIIGIIQDVTAQQNLIKNLEASYQRLNAFFKNSPDLLSVLDNRGHYMAVSKSYEQLFNRPIEEITNHAMMEFLDAEVARGIFDRMEIMQRFGETIREEAEIMVQDQKNYFQTSHFPIPDQDGAINFFGFIAQNITEQKRIEQLFQRNERRLESLLRLSGMNNKSLKEILDFGVEEAIHLTESKLGYLFFYNEATRVFTVYTWSRQAMHDCRIENPMTTYNLADSGLWGETVRQRKAIITNDYAAPNPNKKGFPKGHVPIIRHLGIPIFRGEEIVAVFGLANKESDYTEDDLSQLQLFTDGLWNITERKRIEAELQKVAEQYKNIIATTSDGFVRVNLDGKIVDVNEEYSRMSGYSREELLTRKIADLEAFDSPRQISARVRKLLRVKSLRFETRHRTRTGKILDVEVSATYSPESDDLVCFIRDITGRILAENALRESESRYQKLTQVASEVIFRTIEIPDKKFEFVSPSITQISGYTPEEIYHDASIAWKIYHPDDVERVKRQIMENDPSKPIIARWIHKNGSTVWMELRHFLIVDDQGRLTAVDGIARDITAEKESELELLRLNRTLRTISGCNTVLLHANNEKAFQQDICRLIVENGNYELAWIGLAKHDAARLIEPQAWYGSESGYLELIHLNWNEDDPGPASQAIRNHKTVVINNIAESARQIPGYEEALKRGFRSLIVLPLMYENRVFGCLAIYSDSTNAFNRDEISLLEELARDLAFGMHNMRVREERNLANLLLEKSNAELALAYDATLEGWASALDMREHDTANHSQRVVKLTLQLAEMLGISKDKMIHIRRGAFLHDIGKMSLPDSILLKPGPLSDEEWKVMRQHPINSFRMLSGIPYLRDALDIPYCHHEKWDGTGYPKGLSGEEIPLPARIFALVDVWDALTSERPYRKAWSEEETLEHIKQQSGKHFDPRVVNAFLRLRSKQEREE